jgi:predicted phage-related endonuclease
MTWIDVEQNTPEWMALRAGRVGGSDIGKVMANYGKAFGEPAKRLSIEIAVEQITGTKSESRYSNAHMERGHEEEPVARQLYETEWFMEVANGGYFILNDISGASPDGLVGTAGLIEIKSVISPTQYDTVERGSHAPAHSWQMLYQLWVSGREWVDYVSFCSAFPEGHRLFVERIRRDDCEEKIKKIVSRMDEFAALVERRKEVILNA